MPHGVGKSPRTPVTPVESALDGLEAIHQTGDYKRLVKVPGTSSDHSDRSTDMSPALERLDADIT